MSSAKEIVVKSTLSIANENEKLIFSQKKKKRETNSSFSLRKIEEKENVQR